MGKKCGGGRCHSKGSLPGAMAMEAGSDGFRGVVDVTDRETFSGYRSGPLGMLTR